jgi:hypothetical protein
MANKLKTVVLIDEPDDADILLELTSDQAVTLLRAINIGATLHISLQTPSVSRTEWARENPAAYAQ